MAGLSRILDDGVRARAVGIFALLFVISIAVWAWALLTFHDYPVEIGTAWLADTLGLRHAAAGDNFGLVGALIIGLVLGAWGISFVVYRLTGYDDIAASVS